VTYSTFLEDVKMFPEDVAGKWRREEEEGLATERQKVMATHGEVFDGDVLQVKLANGPLQPLSHVHLSPVMRI
jgi:hypothetical protein